MTLTFSKYQKQAYRTAVYLKPVKVVYPLLGLAGESGEVCELVKKWLRRDNGTELDREKLAKELGDVLWYLAALCTDLGIELSAVVVSDDIAVWGYTRAWDECDSVIVGALNLSQAASKLVQIQTMHKDVIDWGIIPQLIYECLAAIRRLCLHTPYALIDIAQMNLDKLHDRERRGVIQGDGDER